MRYLKNSLLYFHTWLEKTWPNKPYGIELSFLRVVGEAKRGISFFQCEIAWDHHLCPELHSPGFRFYLGAFNITLVEFNIYRV